MQLDGLTCKGTYRRKNLQGYLKTMAEPNEKPLWNDMVAHVLEQQGYHIKEDPRSVYDPDQLWQALERYSPKYDTFVDQKDPHLRDGVAMAWSVFSKPKNRLPLEPLKSASEVQKATKADKFAGLPSMSKKADDFIYALDREQQVLDGTKAPSPCLAGKRTQRGNKTRLVWMYPFEMTIMESRFARPLIDTFLDRRTTMAFGMTKIEIGAIVDSICFHADGTALAMDYSKFDSSIPSYLIRQAFKILGTWFSEEDKKKYGFEKVVKYFLHTPIVMIDGKLYTGKKHGVPSGSYFTQLIDSIVNTILIGAASSKFNLGITWRRTLVLGDDVMVNIPNDYNLEDIQQYFSEFGIVLNIQKTSTKPHFLGAEWYFGKPTRSLKELLSMAVQPETFRKMGDTHSERLKNTHGLLLNYAATYVNGWRLLDGIVHSPRAMNLWDARVDPKFMTGSDKFMFEYAQNHNLRGDSRTTLLKRFMA